MTQTARQTALSVGQAAPDFTLRDQNGVPVSLSEFRGEKNVVVVFYPFAFSGICTGELCEIRDNLGAFVGDDVQVLAISCDHMFSQRGWADKEGYFFPLLSDFWPHGEVTRAYDVFDERKGCPRRSSYVVDKEGLVRWAVHNANPEGRDLDEHVRQLQALA